MNFLFDQLNVSFTALKVVSNFLPKEHKETTQNHLKTLFEALDIAKKKMKELKETLNEKKIISPEDFEFFIPYLLKHIKECKRIIEHCKKEQYMPYFQQKEYKEKTERELNDYLNLAKRCKITLDPEIINFKIQSQKE